MNNQKLYSPESLLVNCCEDESFVHTVVSLFLQHMPQYFQELQDGVATSNWYAVHRNAHTMKASIDLFNIIPLKTLIREIERQGKAKMPESSLPMQLNQLKDLLYDCMEELRRDYGIEN